MDTLKIMLCCGAGMSSGFLASNARKVAKKQKLSVSVEARSHSEVADYMNSIDILMLGPHYAVELDHYRTMGNEHGVPVILIPQDIYAQLDGARLIALAQKTVEEYRK
ncbi:MAG: PTS sugar transporter subunit IIB [Clostridiales bacterium]|nr:PTS sugar transporter subunit IIB [Clostridiales bacterium]